MVSIRKLAAIAGVSPMTVSRAVRNLPGVGEPTRGRILALAEQYHFHPNQVMPGVTTGSSRTLGCILPNIRYSFYNRLLSGILQQAYQAEYRIIVLETHSDPERTRLALHSLIEHRVEGVMIDSEHPMLLSSELLFTLQSNGLMPLCLDSTPSAHPVHAVLSDEGQMAELAVGYLHALGHRTIAYLGTLPHGRGVGRTERPAAVQRALRRYGVPQDYLFDPLPAEYYGQSPDHQLPIIAAPVAQLFTQLMTAAVPPTAFITPSEMIATYLLQLAHRHGLRVPDQLSVLCMGNAELAELLLPPLTTDQSAPGGDWPASRRVISGRGAPARATAGLRAGDPAHHPPPDRTRLLRPGASAVK